MILKGGGRNDGQQGNKACARNDCQCVQRVQVSGAKEHN